MLSLQLKAIAACECGAVNQTETPLRQIVHVLSTHVTDGLIRLDEDTNQLAAKNLPTFDE